MGEAARTPGWPEGAMESCLDWTADQHAQVAADLLDANFVPTSSEDGWDGRPPHRHYSVYDSRDQEPGEQDYAPLIAALVHVGLAIFKSGAPK